MVVIGIDVALTETGVAAIEDGRKVWMSTIKVEGDPNDTGPRYALLRSSLEKLFGRMRISAPDAVAIEQPELAIRKDGKGRPRSTGAILKLYGAFAVCYAECRRLWPKAIIEGVTPQGWKGTLSKELTARMMASKYGVTEFENDHEGDALGLADYAWDLPELKRKRLTDRK